MRAFEILTNRQLIQVLKQWELCAGGLTAIAFATLPGTAQRLRTISRERGRTARLCLHEAIDTETPSQLRAFTGEMARETLAALRGSDNWGDSLIIASDTGQSRAAAVAAAWTRISGQDDIAYWLDPQRYFPNVLIYARLLEAAGYGYTPERAALRKMMKEAVLSGAVDERRIDKPPSSALCDVQESSDTDSSEEIPDDEDLASADRNHKGKSVLELLYQFGDMGIGEISVQAEIPSPIVFDKLWKLEDEGLVERTGNGSDRRLTDAGQKMAIARH